MTPRSDHRRAADSTDQHKKPVAFEPLETRMLLSAAIDASGLDAGPWNARDEVSHVFAHARHHSSKASNPAHSSDDDHSTEVRQFDKDHDDRRNSSHAAHDEAAQNEAARDEAAGFADSDVATRNVDATGAGAFSALGIGSSADAGDSSAASTSADSTTVGSTVITVSEVVVTRVIRVIASARGNHSAGGTIISRFVEVVSTAFGIPAAPAQSSAPPARPAPVAAAPQPPATPAPQGPAASAPPAAAAQAPATAGVRPASFLDSVAITATHVMTAAGGSVTRLAPAVLDAVSVVATPAANLLHGGINAIGQARVSPSSAFRATIANPIGEFFSAAPVSGPIIAAAVPAGRAALAVATDAGAAAVAAAARIARGLLTTVLPQGKEMFQVRQLGNPLNLISDAVAGFANESVLPGARRDGDSRIARAWRVTAAVVAIDVAALVLWRSRNGKRRRSRALLEQLPATPATAS